MQTNVSGVETGLQCRIAADQRGRLPPSESLKPAPVAIASDFVLSIRASEGRTPKAEPHVGSSALAYFFESRRRGVRRRQLCGLRFVAALT